MLRLHEEPRRDWLDQLPDEGDVDVGSLVQPLAAVEGCGFAPGEDVPRLRARDTLVPGRHAIGDNRNKLGSGLLSDEAGARPRRGGGLHQELGPRAFRGS